jgi:hypothetical protein
MTTEPGAQPQPFEAPQMVSSPEWQTQPGATPAALRVQILSTEHWSLLATRSQTWNESFARAQMFLSRDRGAGNPCARPPSPLAAALGVLTAVALNLALTAYSRWAYRR